MRPQLTGSSLPADETLILSDSSLIHVEEEAQKPRNQVKVSEFDFSSKQDAKPAEKLFDFDPANFERQLRYEPLQKVQSATWHQSATVVVQPQQPLLDKTKTQPIKSLNVKQEAPVFSESPKVLPLESNDETDVTIGSMLDEIESQFMTEFWEGDATETMRAEGVSDKHAHPDNFEQTRPLQVEPKTTEKHETNDIFKPTPTNATGKEQEAPSSGKVTSAPSTLPLTGQTFSDSGLGIATSAGQSFRSPTQQNKASPLSDNSAVSRWLEQARSSMRFLFY